MPELYDIDFPPLCFSNVSSVHLDEHFGERRVNVDGLAQLAKGGTKGDVGRHLLDEVCSMGAVDMGAEQLALAGLAAELHHN